MTLHWDQLFFTKVVKAWQIFSFVVAILISHCIVQDDSSPMEPPAGKKLVHQSDRGKEVFIFCPQTVTVEYKNSVHRPHMQSGTWVKDGNTILITWTKEYGGEGIGTPSGDCDIDCRYPSYKSFNREIDGSLKLDWRFIQDHPFGDWDISDHPLDCEAVGLAR